MLGCCMHGRRSLVRARRVKQACIGHGPSFWKRIQTNEEVRRTARLTKAAPILHNCSRDFIVISRDLP